MDMTFVARQLQEKSTEQQRPIYFASIDLTKAYDTVNRIGPLAVTGRNMVFQLSY